MEIKTDICRSTDEKGDDIWVIGPDHTWNDILRWVCQEIDDKDEFLYLAEQVYHEQP